MSESTLNLKETVNLPQTDFPIRAGLKDKEPALLTKWESEQLYTKRKERSKKATDTYHLHDGPPYPNGDIHMGHALNKVLKDIIVRSKTLYNHRSHYVPGWDCHGLPIETQVLKELKKTKQEDKKKDTEWFRNTCKDFALNYVDMQKQDFKKLGIFGEWDSPYLTLNPTYEAEVIRSFAKIAENGLLYKGSKPIHWCMHCETALAEAEIEYADHKSPSVYVTFKITQASPQLQSLITDKSASILVWTTTPWTLPANVALAAHPDFNYVVVNANNKFLVFAEALIDTISTTLEFESCEVVGTIKGSDLVGTQTQHPLIERHSAVLPATYVTQEDGTGFVHIAPGHGQDDYIVGKEHDLPTIMPVDAQGKFTDAVKWKGQNVFDANKEIGMEMDKNGSLLKLKFIKHSYPHCWRCKNPVIFRATEQWFVSMDTPMKKGGQTLREKALQTIKEDVTWYPDWGEKRITAMIENRPDWCISRQRSWGIPIPALSCSDCKKSIIDPEVIEQVAKKIEKEGTMIWFTKSLPEILEKDINCPHCQSSQVEKETDILDVWFESGASFASVLKDNPELSFPANMYLEGSDQHRGWFQSSLLIGLSTEGKAPFKEVLTHGFIVDAKGHKMSKSQGNVISPQKVIQQYGTDILRWWIASSDFRQDISLSDNILQQARDSFSKVRNTLRFCMSNLYDYDHSINKVAYEDLNEIDQWALVKLDELQERIKHGYDIFEFHHITQNIHDFCSITLSSHYLDSIKDRLYCDSSDGHDRRSSQTACFHIVDQLLKLISPILIFTAEDAYSFFPKSNKQESIHLETYNTASNQWKNEAIQSKFNKLLSIKEKVYQKLETLRNSKEIKSFLEANVSITLPEIPEFDDWASFLIVSEVKINKGQELILVEKSVHNKCQRCWRVLPLKEDLCERCETVIRSK